jgi:hypothetical protein
LSNAAADGKRRRGIDVFAARAAGLDENGLA